jgi:hypothetical protein
VRLFPVTVDDGIDVHVNASYFQAQRVRQLQLDSKFFFTVPFLMIFNFYVIKKITFQKLFATHHKSARDPPVWETLV